MYRLNSFIFLFKLPRYIFIFELISCSSFIFHPLLFHFSYTSHSFFPSRINRFLRCGFRFVCYWYKVYNGHSVCCSYSVKGQNGFLMRFNGPKGVWWSVMVTSWWRKWNIILLDYNTITSLTVTFKIYRVI